MSAPVDTLGPAVAAVAARTSPKSSRLRLAGMFLWKYVCGMVLCQGFLGSVMVVGLTFRLMQRTVLRQWWKCSELRRSGLGWKEFVSGSERTRPHDHWPNWLVQQNHEAIKRGRKPVTWENASAFFRACIQSAWLNLRIGAQAIFNTWVLTLPGCILWLFAWYDGWNNSFNKGYEQAAVGPFTGFLGVALFIAAMFYVPLAQARQAATGQWSAFYQFRLVWSLIRRRWLACLGLALLYSALCIPVTILRIAPAYFTSVNPALSNATPAEVLHLLNVYFFWSSLLVLPVYLALRVAAARIYASALLAAAQDGAISEESLADFEWEALHRLDLLQVQPRRVRHPIAQIVVWTSSKLGRLVAGGLLVLVWFTFVAQIFIAEFLNSHPAMGWLNQPLVQLPWFHYLPSSVKNQWWEVFGTLLLLGLVLALIPLFRFVVKLSRVAKAGAPRKCSPSQ